MAAARRLVTPRRGGRPRRVTSAPTRWRGGSRAHARRRRGRGRPRRTPPSRREPGVDAEVFVLDVLIARAPAPGRAGTRAAPTTTSDHAARMGLVSPIRSRIATGQAPSAADSRRQRRVMRRSRPGSRGPSPADAVGTPSRADSSRHSARPPVPTTGGNASTSTVERPQDGVDRQAEGGGQDVGGATREADHVEEIAVHPGRCAPGAGGDGRAGGARRGRRSPGPGATRTAAQGQPGQQHPRGRTGWAPRTPRPEP